MGGVIAAGSLETARVGAHILEQGGNAVDAAVAACFASFVTEMMVVNIGGGGYAMVSDQQGTTSYDFFTSVPSHGEPDTYDFRRIEVDFGVEVQPFFIGRASTAVPGVMAGLCHLADTRGKLGLKTLMEGAIRLAREGFRVTQQFAEVVGLLEPIFCDTPKLQAMVTVGDRLCVAGDHLTFPGLANTLDVLSVKGADHFYRGALAQQIAADHGKNGGRILYEDLARYEVVETRPVRVDYHGYEVILPSPSSLGGMLIGFTLKLLQRIDLSKLPHNGQRHIEVLAYAMRLANRVREELDQLPGGVDPVLHIFDPANMEANHQRLQAMLAGETPEPEQPKPKSGAGNTSHISAMDDEGLAVSITTTAGENAGYTLGDTGLTLNNILGELDLNPHGFHKHPAHQRMMSMMAPTIVCRDGLPVITLGSAGSNRLRSAILQTISNMIDFGMSPNEAINAPRVHHENGVLHLEGGIDPSLGEGLTTTGFNVKQWGSRNLFFGGAQAVLHDSGGLTGGADERRGGATLSVP